jgi:peptidoglycan/xylan/chitin deacetylase (PgdA/CDA1 family)
LESAEIYDQKPGALSALVARARKSVSQRVTRNVSLWRKRSRLSAPLVTFSFDDFPKSAWVNGGPLLKRYGVRATYYVAGALAGATVDGVRQFDREDLCEIAAAGHEIGCHTFDHLRIVFADKTAIETSLARNAQFVRDAAGVEMTTFAYPFGHANLATKYMIAQRFKAARGIWAGLNSPSIDMAQVQSSPLENRGFDMAFYDELIAKTKASNGWLVLFAHDVDDVPSPYGATPAQLEAVLKRVADAGIEVLPFKEAAARAVSE